MRETLIRSLSGAAYVLILTAAVFFSGLTLYLLFGVFLLLAVSEYCRLTHLQRPIPLLVSVLLYGWYCTKPWGRAADAAILLAALTGTLYGVTFLFGKATGLPIMARWPMLVGYVVAPFLVLVQIPFIADDFQPELLFALFLMVWVNDTFAYVVGKSFGRRKLMSLISPKKTIEGFLGGMFFCILAGVALSEYLDQPAWRWMLIALVTSIAGTLGDLFESKLKRIAGVKDSGRIMPGHGGILDRLDSVIFAAPFVFLLFQIFSYVS